MAVFFSFVYILCTVYVYMPLYYNVTEFEPVWPV